MEHNLVSDKETACYIDILKQLFMEKMNVNISGEDIFYLIKGHHIVYDHWIGYDYVQEWKKLSFIHLIDCDTEEILKYISANDSWGIIMFIDSSALMYNDLYIKNEGRTHCIRITDVSSESLYIEDSHIRVNDRIFKVQSAELKWDDLKNVDMNIYAVNLKQMYSEFIEINKLAQNVEALNDYFNFEHSGYSAIKNYLQDVYECIDEIPLEHLSLAIQEIYYNIKINTCIYVNKYIKEVFCRISRINIKDFDIEYIKNVEEKIEKLIYYAIKGNKIEIKNNIKQIIRICEKEKEIFNNAYR